MKPATELPWESHGFMVDSSVVDQMICDCVAEIDAAYIVHAANAYPKLVEALHNLLVMLPSADNEGNDQDRIPASFNYVRWLDIREGRALLRELGEEA